MIGLPDVLHLRGVSQAALARAVGLSPSAVNHWLRAGRLPRVVRDDLERVRRALTGLGVPEGVTIPLPGTALHPARDGVAKKSPVVADTTTGPSLHTPTGDAEMLLRPSPLSQSVLQHYGLRADPFGSAGDPTDAASVYRTPAVRYAAEALWATARHGGLLALVGESGSGKTLLLADLDDRIARDGEPVILILPYVLSLERREARDRSLRATQIAEAILSSLAPGAPVRASHQARYRQLHQALIDSHAQGYMAPIVRTW